MKPQYDQIPEELRCLPNWVVWRREKRANKFVRTGKLAKSNGPDVWSTTRKR